jgi:hypothetical protein
MDAWKKPTGVITRSLTPSTGSSRTPPPGLLTAEAIKAALKRLVSAYRKDDWADAEGFAVQLGTVLEDYPVAIIDQVTHPKTGIQRTCKFPPSIAEVVEACEKAMAPEREREEQARKWREQHEKDQAQIAASQTYRPSEAELDEQFARLGLSHLRPGSKCARAPRVSDIAKRQAQAILDRYAAEAAE